MPKIDGIQILSILAAKQVRFPVMMLSCMIDLSTIKRARETAGASMDFSYFNNPGTGDEIREFIKVISRLIEAAPDYTRLEPRKGVAH